MTHPSSLYVTDDYIVTHNSSLAHNICLNAARNGVGVLELSLEMSARQLGRRSLALASGVPMAAMRPGMRSVDVADRVMRARRELNGLPLHIDDSAGQTPAMIAAKARAISRRHKLGLLMIDHLNLMRADDADAKHGGTWAVGRASNTVLQIAKDCECPVILCVQLNRGPEQREDKRPVLSDLRQSGDIEQDAYAVCFVYRQEYYNNMAGEPEQRDSERPDRFAERAQAWRESVERSRGRAELIWAKVRDGSQGTDNLPFDARIASFLQEDAP